MSKRSSRVADRMAFFSQALEKEKKEHATKRLSMSNDKVMSSSTNSCSTSVQTQNKQENGQQVKTTQSTTESTGSTTKKVEKVVSQRKE